MNQPDGPRPLATPFVLSSTWTLTQMVEPVDLDVIGRLKAEGLEWLTEMYGAAADQFAADACCGRLDRPASHRVGPVERGQDALGREQRVRPRPVATRPSSQDLVQYANPTHHSNLGSYDQLIPEDLMKNATTTTSFAYHAANREQMLPASQCHRGQRQSGCARG